MVMAGADRAIRCMCGLHCGGRLPPATGWSDRFGGAGVAEKCAACDGPNKRTLIDNVRVKAIGVWYHTEN